MEPVSSTGGVRREPSRPLEAGATDDPDLWTREIMLGIVICFAQIPESIAFALMAHVRPPVALHAAWVIGLVCGIFGGRPGMVNGATGAFAAIIGTFIPRRASGTPPSRSASTSASCALCAT